MSTRVELRLAESHVRDGAVKSRSRTQFAGRGLHASILAISEIEPLKQFNVYLPADLIRAIKHHAVDTEQSLSAIASAAMTEYLARHNTKASKRGKRRDN